MRLVHLETGHLGGKKLTSYIVCIWYCFLSPEPLQINYEALLCVIS